MMSYVVPGDIVVAIGYTRIDTVYSGGVFNRSSKDKFVVKVTRIINHPQYG